MYIGQIRDNSFDNKTLICRKNFTDVFFFDS